MNYFNVCQIRSKPVFQRQSIFIYCLLLIYSTVLTACEDPPASQNGFNNQSDIGIDASLNDQMSVPNRADQILSNDIQVLDQNQPPDLTLFPDINVLDMYQSQPTSNLTLGNEQAQLVISYGGGFSMTWQGYDQEYLHFDTHSIRIAWTEMRDPLLNYDPYPMITNATNYVAPSGLVWTSVIDAEPSQQNEENVTFILQMTQGYRALLTLNWEDQARVALTLTALTPIETERIPFIAFFEINPQMLDVDEHEIYGLGEWYDTVTHKGKIRSMHLTLDSELEQGYNEVHAPIPYLSSSHGWGMFFASDAPTVFDVAYTDSTRVKTVLATENTIPVENPSSSTFYLFASEHPLDLNRHYYQITGWPRLPASWALGPWIWRDEHEDQAQVESDLRYIRDLDLPTSGFWIDRPYGSAIGAFNFDPNRFSNPQVIAQLVKTLGFKLALWHAPYIDVEAEESASLYQEADRLGYFPSQAGLLLNAWSKPLDFTQEAVRTWWQEKLTYYQSLGVAGYKLDYAEDIVVGLNGRRIPWQFADDSNELTMHNQYQRLYHQTYADTLAEDGGFLICRTARWGDQVNLNVMWPADLDADFSHFKERRNQGTDNEYGAVGGIPAALSAGLSLSASGFPFYASDTGGYRHAPPDKETFMRWLEMSALGTVMQTGTNSNDVPWEFNDENGFDDEVLNTYRRYAVLNIRLFPYKWTYAQQLKPEGNGRALMRPLGLAYPQLQRHVSDHYLLGEELLVAPVIERDAREKEVHFPPGTWINWWDHSVWEGGEAGRSYPVEAPLDTLPLFAKAGSLIPMIRPSIDTLAPVINETQGIGQNNGNSAGQNIESFADDPGLIWIRAVGTSVIIDDFDHQFTLYDATVVELHTSTDQVSLHYQAGQTFEQGVVFVIPGISELPEQLQLDEVDLLVATNWEAWQASMQGAYFDLQTQTLYVKQSALQTVLTWQR
jgi:alpha-D-xyloside xylohydrolase